MPVSAAIWRKMLCGWVPSTSRPPWNSTEKLLSPWPNSGAASQ
jgi:hypothetical protein